MAQQTCPESHPTPKPFHETGLGKLPPEIRSLIFKDVLTVRSTSSLKDGFSVRIKKTKAAAPRKHHDADTVGPAKPASCLALLLASRHIYLEAFPLFYALNTFFLSSPRKLRAFLRHIGPLRRNEIRSLHLENIIVPVPFFSANSLARFREYDDGDDDLYASMVASRMKVVHPDMKRALGRLNASGRFDTLHLFIRPSQALQCIGLCTRLPGCERSAIAFESPSRWVVMVPSRERSAREWFEDFVQEYVGDPGRVKPYAPSCDDDAKFRVEVDLWNAGVPRRRLVGGGGVGDDGHLGRAM